MKHLEFYRKYKTTYPPIANPLFSKGNWWRIVLITVIAILIGPLILYRNQRSIPFSFDHYLRLSKYFLAVAVPFVSFLIWTNWRELTKRSKGYGWVGKFEVIDKRSILAFYYFILAPGENNQIKVSRRLFEKTRVGDFILIRRDVFGTIEEVNKVNGFSTRLTKVRSKNSQESIKIRQNKNIKASEPRD